MSKKTFADLFPVFSLEDKKLFFQDGRVGIGFSVECPEWEERSVSEINAFNAQYSAFLRTLPTGAALQTLHFYYPTKDHLERRYNGYFFDKLVDFYDEKIEKNHHECYNFLSFSPENEIDRNAANTFYSLGKNITSNPFKGITRTAKNLEDYSLTFKNQLEAGKVHQKRLSDEELEQIWQSALKFGKKITSNEEYIPPDKYNAEFNLKPSEYSDIGQAEVFVREYQDKLRYSPSTKYLVYNGGYWEESDLKAQGLSQDLANRQVEEADILLKKARDEMKKNGALGLLDSLTTKKAVSLFNKEQTHSYNQYLMAENYKKYAVKRGDTRAIHATTKEAMPMLEIKQEELDQDGFLLNTPSYTIDLKTGEKMEHNPLNFTTKQTMVDPSDEGKSLWEEALDTFFCGDDELIDYVQKVAGLAAIGKVYVEALIIAYGEGRNGKSTFWNAIARVLGSYSGSISADILTVGCKRNAKPELAEARGKRLLIAAELEEGMRLSTSNVKQLSSTDDIHAEKKYKAPFKFTPSHSLVLYTNHLPKVGAMDEGTWRRLIVIPFEAKIEGTSDIKNYGDYLFQNAGGAILKWVIDGSKKAIEDDYKFKLPDKVENAINKYRSDNDWISRFFESCCEIDESFSAKSGEFYTEYRAFCMRTGEYTRSTTDFYNALEAEGFKRKRTSKGRFILGIRLKSEFLI